jgi:hypothetical protein
LHVQQNQPGFTSAREGPIARGRRIFTLVSRCMRCSQAGQIMSPIPQMMTFVCYLSAAEHFKNKLRRWT